MKVVIFILGFITFLADNGSHGETVYTIYGNSQCPRTSDIELVYDGLVAKAAWKESGGGVNYQCLSKKPLYLDYEEGVQDAREYIMGVEYENWNKGPLSNVHHQGVPCAVCHILTRSVSLMIPGRYECPETWTREYYGYLTAERYNHPSPSTYTCVDVNTKVVPRSANNTGGGTMMPVETYCESHICPPYEKGKELTCVVCSK